MYNNRKSIAALYKQQSVLTASPGELTLMLYNACIKDIKVGMECINQQKIEQANHYLKHAQAIIRELTATLDMKYPIAAEMKKLYGFIYEKLVWGNIHKDKQALQEALKFVEEFRNTWFELIKQVEKNRNAI